MDSWVQLAMEREPSYFLACDLMGESTTVIACTQGDRRVVGMGSYSILPVHINGKPQTAIYLGALRVNPQFRHKIRVLKNAYTSLKLLLQNRINSSDDLSLTSCFTSIASENIAARRVLEAGLRGLPRYNPIGELRSLVISTGRGKDYGLLRPLTAKNVNEFTQFFNTQACDYQYSAHLSARWINTLDGSKGLNLHDFYLYRDNGKIAACMAIWDQGAFKQIRVRAYQFPLNILRPVYNGFALLTGRTLLPATGQLLQQAYLSFLMFSGVNSETQFRILQNVLAVAASRGLGSLVVGVCNRNPTLPVLTRFPCHIYKTVLQTVSWEDRGPQMNISSAQPEIALL